MRRKQEFSGAAGQIQNTRRSTTSDARGLKHQIDNQTDDLRRRVKSSQPLAQRPRQLGLALRG
jgi:hypothetical protein